jgi:uridine phosphorylase
MTDQPQHHIQCVRADVADYALLPGDPARAAAIAEHFDDARHIATHREFTTYTGTWKGVRVTAMSTGIGGPSLAIGVEELHKLGVSVMIRVGTCGSMQSHVAPGDFVVATGAIRDEGTSRAYLPLDFPAVADHAVTDALLTELAKTGRHHAGVVHSKDSFYAQKEPARMPVASELKERWSAWTLGGALASEMEAATLFVVSSALRVKAGTACLVASSPENTGRLSKAEHSNAMDVLITSTLDAVARLDQHARSSRNGAVR